LTGERVFYDVGANFGYFALYAAGIAGYEGSIHAFEPMPDTFADLERCVGELGLGPRVACHPIALSDRAGPGLMATADPLHSALARLVDGEPERPPRGARTVTLARLDDLDLAPPFLVKIDVEEHEAQVLAGGEALLRRQRPMLVVESWLARGRPARTLAPLRFLEALGYALYDPCWAFDGADGRYVWPEPDPMDSGGGPESRRLALVRFAAEHRFMLRDQINVFACHESRIDELAERFRAGSGAEPG
jgi:FkbM family methyltransferase